MNNKESKLIDTVLLLQFSYVWKIKFELSPFEHV